MKIQRPMRSAILRGNYSAPGVRTVEVKPRRILCQSRDIRDAGEDIEDIFGNDEN